SNAVDISGNISFEDDGPAVAIVLDANADVTLDESGDGAGAVTLTAGSSYTAGNDPDVAGSNALSIATSGTAIVDFAANNPAYGADGQGGDPTYALQLDAVGPLSNLTLTDGSTITLVEENGVIYGVVDNGTFAGQAAFAIGIDTDTGVVTVEQYLSLEHPNPNSDDEAVTLDTGAISVVVTVEDGDDDTATSNAVDISGNISFEDDGPAAVAADALTGTNEAGFYIEALNGGFDVDANYGADGGRVIFTQASIDALEAQNLTSGLAPLEYSISSDGTVLTAAKAGGGSTVFTITLDPENFDDLYVLQMYQPLDAVTNVDFNDGGYNFVGGNGAWAGFNQPGTNDSFDLLLTPEIGGVNNGTVNTSDIAGGVGSGNSLGLSSGTNLPETLQVNYVQDLGGDPGGSGGYGQPGNRDHTFEENLTTNGASALFTSSAGTEIKITAWDDTDNDNDLDDGVQDDITGIVISNGGESSELIADPGNTNPIPVTVGGDNYTVTFNNDGTVNVTGVNGSSGAQAEGTRIAVFTDQQGVDQGENPEAGYTTLEFTYVSGDTIKVGDFGATIQSDDPVGFTVPISVIDNDDDVVSSGELDITLNPAMNNAAVPSAKAASLDMAVNDNDGLVSLSTVSTDQQATRIDMRPLEMATVAAMAAGFFMPEVRADLNQTFGDPRSAGHDMVNFEFAGGFDMAAVQLPEAYAMNFEGFVQSEPGFAGGDMMASILGTQVDFGGRIADMAMQVQSEGPDFAAMAMQAPEFSGGPSAFEGFANMDAGSAMEALLMLEAPGKMVDVAAMQEPGFGVGEAVAELAAAAQVDAIVDYFADAHDGVAMAISPAEGLLDSMVANDMAQFAMGMAAQEQNDDVAALAAASA
ncbi:DUF5801 repeats-in-toxin domain-containing protein, partial [Qipengyuania sphaerica]|uniref:DUF5801 repeats-in-toxin domain-containing protein n=1 Tax=Qipengyuania sphaerica TaxID=2867243 RepID=UPI001FFC474F